MAWIYLLTAGIFEIGFAILMKAAQGQWRFAAAVGFLVCLAASLFFLNLALRSVPVGTAYAIWTGIGAAGTAILGMVLFHEPATAARLAFLTLLIVALVGLRLTASI